MLITALTFIVILTILVLIHELGHYTVARIIGVKVEEFGLGLPPRAIGKKIHGIFYSINWLPIGGFVKLAGEDEAEDENKKSKSETGIKRNQFFWARSKLERSAILTAGVTMNFLLAIGITVVLLIGGINEAAGRVHVETVSPGSPAAIAGIKPNDIIVSIQSADLNEANQPAKIKVTSDLINATKKLAGTPIKLDVQNGSNRRIVILTPRTNPPKGEGSMGVSISDMEIHKYSLWQAPTAAVRINLERAWLMLTGIVSTIWGLLSFKQLSPDVAGPIGIAEVTGQAVKFGFRAVLDFASILSLNLAILNILPIPALDGGRLAFIVVERILGRKVRPAFERQTHQIGMIILLILVVLVSINDISRLTHGG
jgi:regulator of sigma E protease